MKRVFILMLGAMLATFSGCKDDTEEVIKEVYETPVWKGSLDKAPENAEAGWAYFNTVDQKSYMFDGKKWNKMSDIDESRTGLIFLGETKETVYEKECTVKSYAVIRGDSLFYDYYKNYYYDNYLYIEKSFSVRADENGVVTPYNEFSEKDFKKSYSEKVYYPTGIVHFNKSYTSYGKLSYSSEYREDDRPLCVVHYDLDGKEYRRTDFSYYDNGNKKSEIQISDGKVRYKYLYSEDGVYQALLNYDFVCSEVWWKVGNSASFMSIDYDHDNKVSEFEYKEEDGDSYYLKYEWSTAGYVFTTYDKNGDIISSKYHYTEEDVVKLIESLRPFKID